MKTKLILIISLLVVLKIVILYLIAIFKKLYLQIYQKIKFNKLTKNANIHFMNYKTQNNRFIIKNKITLRLNKICYCINVHQNYSTSKFF